MPRRLRCPAEPMRKLLSTALLIFLAGNASAQSAAQSGFKRIEDVVYGRKFGTALTMDVFQPTNANACGILFLVNGGWLSSKATPNMVTIQPDYYRPFLERGYTFERLLADIGPGLDAKRTLVLEKVF